MNLPAMQETPVRFLGREDPLERDRLPTPVFLGFSMTQLVKNPPAMRETWVWIPGLGRSPGEGEGSPFQYSGLENSMDCIVHGIAKSRLSDFHKTFNRTKADLRNTGRNFAKR